MLRSLLSMERTGWSERRKPRLLPNFFSGFALSGSRSAPPRLRAIRWLRNLYLTAHPPLLCEEGNAFRIAIEIPGGHSRALQQSRLSSGRIISAGSDKTRRRRIRRLRRLVSQETLRELRQRRHCAGR